MTQQKLEAWLLASGFNRRLNTRYRRDFIDLKIVETEPDVFEIRIMIFAPDCETFLDIQLPLTGIEVVDNSEVQF